MKRWVDRHLQFLIWCMLDVVNHVLGYMCGLILIYNIQFEATIQYTYILTQIASIIINLPLMDTHRPQHLYLFPYPAKIIRKLPNSHPSMAEPARSHQQQQRRPPWAPKDTAINQIQRKSPRKSRWIRKSHHLMRVNMKLVFYTSMRKEGMTVILSSQRK